MDETPEKQEHVRLCAQEFHAERDNKSKRLVLQLTKKYNENDV